MGGWRLLKMSGLKQYRACFSVCLGTLVFEDISIWVTQLIILSPSIIRIFASQQLVLALCWVLFDFSDNSRIYVGCCIEFAWNGFWFWHRAAACVFIPNYFGAQSICRSSIKTSWSFWFWNFWFVRISYRDPLDGTGLVFFLDGASTSRMRLGWEGSDWDTVSLVLAPQMLLMWRLSYFRALWRKWHRKHRWCWALLVHFWSRQLHVR